MRFVIAGDTNIQDREVPVSAFAKVKALFETGEVLLGHAEGMFTEAARDKSVPSLPYKDRWRHSTPEMLSGFADAGFDAVSMASNVTADPAAVAETVDVAAKVGLRVSGIGKTKKEARRPALFTKRDTTVALLSRTSVFWPHLVPATETRPGAATVRAYVAYQPGRRALEMPGASPIVVTWPDAAEIEALTEDIRGAKKDADCVILSMHWGVSSSTEVHDYQRAIAHASIDAGASLVFGHHPHLVCPLEVYNGVPIFYGLGNFAFDWEKARNRLLDGILLSAEWDPGKKAMTEVRVTPVRRGDDNLIAELPKGAPEAEKTRDFLVDTAIEVEDAKLTTAGNDVILAL